MGMKELDEWNLWTLDVWTILLEVNLLKTSVYFVRFWIVDGRSGQGLSASVYTGQMRMVGTIMQVCPEWHAIVVSGFWTAIEEAAWHLE
ncbi:hypothetical protein BGW39_001695 [Mortierella sp. 14UC]|nr:hypothetical protein BGW39_001695 [Mortierella sp. 14UC]